MFNNFTEEARKILILAKEEMSNLNHPYVGSEHLLLAILNSDNDVSKKLKDFNLDYNTFRNKIIEIIGIGSKKSEWFLYTPLLKRIMENSVLDSQEAGVDVDINILFSNMLEEADGVAIRILINLNIDIEKLYDEFSFKPFKKKKDKKLLLDELGVDLTKKARNNELDPVFGRDKEINRLLEILCRRCKNNPILVGEAGVGKTAIVEQLSRLIASNEVPYHLKNKRIISLDMASVVAGTKYRGEFEDRVKKILKEAASDEDIILFIDEIHTLVGAGGAEGAIDASNIFKPALARGEIKVIGATTLDEYKKYILSDKALERRFQKVYIEIPDSDVVFGILKSLKPIYEEYHNVKLTDDILKNIIDLSKRYIFDRFEPDKSIDILDEVCSRTSLKEDNLLKEYNSLCKNLSDVIIKKDKSVSKCNFKEAKLYKNHEFELMDKINDMELKLCKMPKKKVTLNDVAYVIYSKTKIPIYEILNDNESLNNINLELNKIKGQDEAIKELLKIAKKIKLGFKDDDKCYSIMFSGPSGVGKTALAKQFGNIFTPNVIKLDMSEYSEAHSVSKIIGSPAGYVGYNDNKNILEEIKNKPFSVLILDEIERASSSVVNLFYQILDDGFIKDSKGSVVSFKNVIIIMTSNIGFNTHDLGFNKNIKENKLKEYFDISFINRIDNIICFNYLDEVTIKDIIKLKLESVKDKYKDKVDIKINDGVVEDILKLSNYKEFGARKIEKLIKDKIEDIIIDKIVENKKEVVINNLVNV